MAEILENFRLALKKIYNFEVDPYGYGYNDFNPHDDVDDKHDGH
jgi:hypothetical protein